MPKYIFSDKLELLTRLDKCEGTSIEAKLRTLRTMSSSYDIPEELSGTTLGQWLKQRELIKYAVETGSGHRAKLTEDQMSNFLSRIAHKSKSPVAGECIGRRSCRCNRYSAKEIFWSTNLRKLLHWKLSKNAMLCKSD